MILSGSAVQVKGLGFWLLGFVAVANLPRL
jgi:hypothetical protein